MENKGKAVMSSRFNIALSDDLAREIARAAEEAETSQSEIFRKALQLFLAARDGRARGLKFGLVNPETMKLETEVIGI